MYDNHLERVEQKYLIDNSLKEILISKINNHIEKDKFFKSNIRNIYFDTNNNDLIINSIEKPIFKDKFRARCYGNCNEVFLEIKTKYKGIVGKRRIKLDKKQYYEFINNKNRVSNEQIFKELDYYFKYYKLKPVIYIAYDRESYKGINDKNLRITFDKNLRSRRDNLILDDDTKTVNYFNNDSLIMEIKTVGAMPLWLVRTLSDLKILPISFSKYGKIYEKEKNEESDLNVK